MMNVINRHKILTAVAFIIFGIAIIGISFVATKWNQPLSKGVVLPPLTQEISNIDISVENLIIKYSSKSDYKLSSLNTPYCGGPPSLTILGLIISTNDKVYQFGRVDGVRIIRIDFVTPMVKILAIPRDIWVNIPEIFENSGISEGKLSQSYFFGFQEMGYYNGLGEGAGLMTMTLAKNFGLYIDSFGSVSISILSDVIDEVGGLDIYLLKDADGRSLDLGYFSAGENHFSGEAAMRYSRIPLVQNDNYQVDRQTEVLNALQEKVLSPSILPKIPNIVSHFRDSVITTLTPKDISALICLIPQITEDRLNFLRLPDNILSPVLKRDPILDQDISVWVADDEAVRELIEIFQGGN